MKFSRLLPILGFIIFSSMLVSCEDGKSYSDLLDEEENSINWYLSQQKVEGNIPVDSNFITGPDAPFYRMNSEGTVYMRVIERGDMNNRPAIGQTVYLRFMRYDIKTMWEGNDSAGVGNAENMGLGNGSLSLVYGNNVLTTTTQYGEGIQVPLEFLGYNCEVDLIVSSTLGFTSEISDCIPYLYKNLKFFKAEY